MTFLAPRGSHLDWDMQKTLAPKLVSFPPLPLDTDAHTQHSSPPGTYVFIRRLVGADQVRVETREADNRPDGEEAHHGLQHSGLESRSRTGKAGGLSGCPRSQDDKRFGRETPTDTP